MGEKTKIAWATDTLNFWSGCTEVSPGCVNCYARELAHRFEKAKGSDEEREYKGPTFGGWGKGAPRRLHESAFKLARKLNKLPWICDTCGKATDEPDHGHHFTPGPAKDSKLCVGPPSFHRRRIFSLSLGDWLDPEVPAEWLARMLETIRICDDVVWLLCTKRPELFRDRLTAAAANVSTHADTFKFIRDWYFDACPPKHVITLTSVENQQTADERIPHALRIPSACRGLSVEPLLGPVDLYPEWWLKMAGIDWIIIGGESGPHARPCDAQWIWDVLRQGQAAGCACFVKQLGSNPVENAELGNEMVRSVKLRDSKGGDMEEWPADLRVRQWAKGF